MPGLIILAAGSSARLGQPKQLLMYKGESLIRRAVHAGIDAHCTPIVVVLGAHFEEIKPEIEAESAHIAYNPYWQEGIASSIRIGVSELRKKNIDIEETIIMLCDQPMADATLFKNMMLEKRKTGKGIVSCSYNDTIGVPVLYHKTYFGELLALKGDDGAKKILIRHRNEVGTIPFPGGAIDIDTMNDYKDMLKY